MRPHLVLASATLAIVVTASLQGVPSTHAQNDPASRAIRYLQTQQHADGSIDGTAGETEDTVMGAAAAGYDPATLRSASGKTALEYLATVAAAQKSAPNAGQVAKLALAVIAAGQNPTAFGGADLFTLLATTYHSTTGAYGDGATSLAAATGPERITSRLEIARKMTTATRNTARAISAFCEISPPQDALTALSLIDCTLGWPLAFGPRSWNRTCLSLPTSVASSVSVRIWIRRSTPRISSSMALRIMRWCPPREPSTAR